MASASRPSWRKIETALIDLLRDEGFEIEQTGGESYVEINNVTICFSDFAKELEERL